MVTYIVSKGDFWKLFQAIRADGDKKFSTSPLKVAVEKVNPDFLVTVLLWRTILLRWLQRCKAK